MENYPLHYIWDRKDQEMEDLKKSELKNRAQKIEQLKVLAEELGAEIHWIKDHKTAETAKNHFPNPNHLPFGGFPRSDKFRVQEGGGVYLKEYKAEWKDGTGCL